jgi:DNA-directed RNA polymerase specialized sigma24 family protein
MSDLDAHLPGIVAGDPEPFASWVAGAESRLRSSLRPFATHLDAEAVLQECLLRVWQVAPRFEPDARPDALLRFGLRIARNLAISELRRLRVRPSLVASLADAPLPEPTVEPIHPDPLLRRIIAVCRDKLPGKPARALQARLAGGSRRAYSAQPRSGAVKSRSGKKISKFLEISCRGNFVNLGNSRGRAGEIFPKSEDFLDLENQRNREIW